MNLIGEALLLLMCVAWTLVFLLCYPRLFVFTMMTSALIVLFLQ